MRRHSRWAVAAVAVAFAVAASSPASDARTHRRAHRAAPRVTQPPQTPELQLQTPGASARGVATSQRPEAVSAGKGAMSATTIAARDVEAILGKSVRSSAGEDMGRLVDVVVDPDGRPRAAIIDFGGFLGVGSRKIAVDWGALKFAPKDEKGQLITVELTRDQVKAAPEFKEGSAVVVLGAAAGAQPTQVTPPQAQEK